MSTFKYFYFFANSSNSLSDESKRQRSRGRVCRVEELEGREMLSVTPWLGVESCDNTFPCENAPVYESSLMVASSEPMQASSAPWNAQARDLEVYNDLVARGSGLEFNWNNDGFITYICICEWPWGSIGRFGAYSTEMDRHLEQPIDGTECLRLRATPK